MPATKSPTTPAPPAVPRRASSDGTAPSGRRSLPRARALAHLVAQLPLAAALALGGCGAAPPVVHDPLAALARAESLIAEGRPEQAAELLQAADEASYRDEDLARYRFALARALFESGEPWAAFRVIRDFTEHHPLSSFVKQVERLEFEIGRVLIRSDEGFLFFTSDQRDGVAVLRHLVQRYPRSEYVPDALRLLGESAYRDGEFATAVEDYTRLVREYPSSEWLMLAQFRIAMARFRGLHGPQYDLVDLENAQKELRAFLATRPDNPQYVAEAEEALAATREWIARRHLLIAEFYETVGNALGRRLHLEQAAAEEFAGTRAGIEARERLASEAAAAATAPEAPATAVPTEGAGATGQQGTSGARQEPPAPQPSPSNRSGGQGQARHVPARSGDAAPGAGPGTGSAA